MTSEGADAVSTRQIVIDVPEEVFSAENPRTEAGFGRELCLMAAVKL